MTTLSIYIFNSGILAVEREYGEEVKYVQSFARWSEVLATLGEYMECYAWIEVKHEESVQ